MTGAFIVSTLAGVTVATGLGLAAATLARKSRAASRHALLAAALGVSLLFPVFAAVMPPVRIAVPIATPAEPVGSSSTADVGPVDMSVTSPEPAGSVVPPAPQFSWPSLSSLMFGVWLAGAIVVLAPVWAGLRQMRWLRRTALPWRRGQSIADSLATAASVRRSVAVLQHESIAGPVTCGVRRAVVVLPVDAETWPRADLDRALVHELEHVRRHDWLTQCVARALCACYWFHPLIWITRRQLVLEAERACDDAVLTAAQGAGAAAEATAYADQLVGLAKRLSATARQPLLAMADRRDLSTRVHALLDARQPRGRASALLLSILAAASLGLVIALSPLRMVVEASDELQAATDAPRFEVASIRPCDGKAPAPEGRMGGPGALSSSPGRLHIECAPLLGADGLIRQAYAKFANGQVNRYWAFLPIVGGPDWASSERFTIDARAEGTPSLQMMKGPMLQALLVDGFHLRSHHETRQVPIYELAVATSGAKLRAFAGKCTPIDFAKDIPTQLEADGSCVFVGAKNTWDAPGQTIDDFIKTALSDLDRPVVNVTGLPGRFDFHLDLTADDSADRVATIAVALQRQLGLTLRPATGPADFLVIDGADRPAPGGVALQSAGKQKFDAVSVKPCENEPPTPPGQRSSQGGFPTTSPGHFMIECGTVERLISVAYVRFGETLTNQDARIGDISWMKNAPGWVRSDKFTIEARAAGTPDDSVMRGPMLRALLEDRFKLQIHRVTEDAPMYALTVAKGGLKIKPMAPDGCAEYTPDNPPPPGAALPKPICGGMSMAGNPGRMVWNVGGEKLSEFAHTLSAWMDRYVIDRTGVTDTFNIHLEYAPDEHTPGPDKRGPARTELAEPNAPSIFQALEQQVGLKLEPTKGPQTTIVVDHVERPTPNSAADAASLGKPASPPARAKGPGR
ncbi:MAG TPA: TIGR03435 family protein [Vicinamibacterales bacterium]|nr:TIGR03435 family protein [Vicinamibacterales bacterium]